MATGHQLATLVQGGSFFECPRWRDGRWWVSDVYRRAVLCITPDGVSKVVATVEQKPSGLGWMPDGTMLVVSMADRRVLRMTAGGALGVHADLAGACRGQLNDMVVDGLGRAYVGSFGFDLEGGADPAPASLIRVDPDGSVVTVADDLLFPNGCVITPDGSLIVSETIGGRLTTFTIAEDGSLVDRRIWAQLAPSPALASSAETLADVRVAPDGCCLDAEGCIWAADAIGARCLRVAPGGEIVDQIEAPDGHGVFACMLGGDDGRDLLLCIAPDFFEDLRRRAPEARLLTARAAVPGAGLP